MKRKIKELLEDSLVIKICQSFILISFLFLAMIIWKWRELPAEMPLFYSLARGNEQLTSPIGFLILPFFSVSLFTIHFILAIFIFHWEKLAAKILLISALMVTLALLLTFIRIIFLIT
ncbi:hypothetical protein A3D78_02365 [Candidatus Gottesmanbacteria bacterium RIFCSPHIGHO2_02_FULL_39_14]|uniref:DUF1648 domain-containing protein n=3 Tax=Candidatus Gottesmaniibacteriota TaxID=1752720 RepID=A0A1F6A2D6_9BACT|nr:MAG: hypothetical protein A2153_00470 [Candidatus Gottesmanbacteria bacterium RBG_16_38_7b]OGG18836.1 MAG: hypothetical protein A3D78_02365 [Candidatus Gottesmanbacteria bacterium RIFCSPHIGHO2_02_FULL_39_14]OGG31170.1 MAG: hypothetical protein A3I51_00525 [Candidatus Gottesmanbacteria bacterium RIFCSPLOWO2_02_FULL_38_8]